MFLWSRCLLEKQTGCRECIPLAGGYPNPNSVLAQGLAAAPLLVLVFHPGDSQGGVIEMHIAHLSSRVTGKLIISSLGLIVGSFRNEENDTERKTAPFHFS